MNGAHELHKRLNNTWVFYTTLENGTPWTSTNEPDQYKAIGNYNWMLYQLLHNTTTWDDILETYEAPTPEDILCLVAILNSHDTLPTGKNLTSAVTQYLSNATVILVVDGPSVKHFIIRSRTLMIPKEKKMLLRSIMIICKSPG
ncbi:6050_t:CDS:1 [Paraglomus occultum]|uniref:6050_t:CDS:1 n=1 Tax=Paraglomus occultum TaxID=144539 RepID=A0A9N8W2S0_9GLOM|nr:6050_t:CDS:1 [Paraglomus occultum]